MVPRKSYFGVWVNFRIANYMAGWFFGRVLKLNKLPNDGQNWCSCDSVGIGNSSNMSVRILLRNWQLPRNFS